MSINPYNYIIYRSGSTYYAKKNDGAHIASSASPDLVIQTTLDQTSPTGVGPGDIYIQSGLYNLSSSFAGFNIKSSTRLRLDTTALLSVPNGYSGYVFKLGTGTTNCIIDGGTIRELEIPLGAIPQRRWTAIQLQATTDGVFFNKFLNTTIRDANIGVRLLVDGLTGWINANSFQFLKMWLNNIFIDFDMTVPWPGGQIVGIYRNHFENIECQSGSNTRYGVRNIRHRSNIFIDVKIWDIPSTSITSNVHSDADHTIIIGGIMTNRFTNSGRNTKILDEWNTNI